MAIALNSLSTPDQYNLGTPLVPCNRLKRYDSRSKAFSGQLSYFSNFKATLILLILSNASNTTPNEPWESFF